MAGQIAKTVAPFVCGATVAQLQDAFVYDLSDMAKVLRIAMGKLA